MTTTIGEFIKRDHDDFRLMFERLMNSTQKEQDLRREVYPFLKTRIHAHHVAEEATVFPAMEKLPDLAAITLVLIEEHRGMDLLADDLLKLSYAGVTWRPRIFPFYDVISAHWKREETDVFVHAPYYFTAKELADLGSKFETILRREWKKNGVHGAVPRVMYRR
jgi:hemerythrin superfamily protein